MHKPSLSAHLHAQFGAVSSLVPLLAQGHPMPQREVSSITAHQGPSEEWPIQTQALA